MSETPPEQKKSSLPADSKELATAISFGEYIRQQRKAKGISLETIAESSNIRIGILEALENDDRDGLPAEVFVRGFIRIYAEQIGIDPEECLGRYWELEENKKPGSQANSKKAMTLTPVDRAPIFSMGLIFGLGLLAVFVLFLAYLGFGGLRSTEENDVQLTIEKSQAKQPGLEASFAPQSQEKAPEKAAATAEKAATPEPPPQTSLEPAATAEAANSAVPAEPTVAQEVNYILQARFIEDSWLWIQVDDQDSEEFTFRKEESHTWKAAKNIDIYFGNAGGAVLTLNNKQLPMLGEPGKTIKVSIPKDFAE